MEKQELDSRITKMAKTIYSYCASTVSDPFEAEDLSQEIICQIYRSAGSLRNDQAFYGFLWAVADNVYKNWCKRRANTKESILQEDLPAPEPAEEDDCKEIYLLRRELSLLYEKYRKAVILYYMKHHSCSEIARLLSVSESMVKYLLFKSRKILKEGMCMERNYGSQSYDPKGLKLLFWGNNAANYYHLADSMIAQNILFACYNDKLTAQEISLQLGVALPYLEKELTELHQSGLLKKEGSRYTTNIVIFTRDLAKELTQKTAVFQEQIAVTLMKSITEKTEDVSAVGFSVSDMSEQTFRWQMVSFILYKAVIEKLQNRLDLNFPAYADGAECFIWGTEPVETDVWTSPFGFGISHVINARGDYIQFMDFNLNGDMVHHYFYGKQNATNLFLEIAAGKTGPFSENDASAIADMIRKGYVRTKNNLLSVNAPVLTSEQYQTIKLLFQDTAEQIVDAAEKLMDTVASVIKDHIPAHLKNQARPMAYFRLFEDAISAPVKRLFEKQYLTQYTSDGYLPTTCIILK